MKIKMWGILLSIILLLSMLAACDTEEAPVYTLTLPNTSENWSISSPAEEGLEPKPTTHATGNQVNGLEFVVTPEEDIRIMSGTLSFSILKAESITNVSKINNIQGFVDAFVPIYGEDGEQIYKYNSSRWPSFICDNGDLVEGAELVLIHVSVKNIDAAARTSKDVDENGYYAGNYDDPYIFRADNYIGLVDTGKKISNTHSDAVFTFGSDPGNFQTWYPCYFSESNTLPEHPMAYRLEPGEEVTYCIGFLVGNNRNGSSRDLSNLCARVAHADFTGDHESEPEQIYYINLNLGGS